MPNRCSSPALLGFSHLCTLTGACCIHEDKTILYQSVCTAATISGSETVLEMKPGSMAAVCQFECDVTFPMLNHTLYHSVLLSLIHIYIKSYTLLYTHTILKKKQRRKNTTETNSLPSKCKQNLNITGTLPFAFRRQEKDTFFISSNLQL